MVSGAEAIVGSRKMLRLLDPSQSFIDSGVVAQYNFAL